MEHPLIEVVDDILDWIKPKPISQHLKEKVLIVWHLESARKLQAYVAYVQSLPGRAF